MGTSPSDFPDATELRAQRKIRTETLMAKINSKFIQELATPGSSILRASQKLIISRKNKQGFG